MKFSLTSLGITPSGTDNYIKYSKFMDALNINTEFTSGLLPPGTVFYAVSRGDEIIAIEVPKHRRKIKVLHPYGYNFHASEVTDLLKFNESHTRDSIVSEVPVRLPSLLFIFRLRTNTTFRSEVYALSEPLTSLDQRLYTFPLGNVYSDGTICWGDVPIATANNTLSLGSAPYLFLDSKFNEDLDRGKDLLYVTSGGFKLSVRICHMSSAILASNHQYELVPSKSRHSLNEFIENSL